MPVALTNRGIRPVEAIRCWAGDGPVAAVIAGDPNGRTRHSLVTQPTTVHRLDSWAAAADLIGSARRAPSQAAHPFGTGWIVSLPYGMGLEFEPAAAHAGSCIQHTQLWLARVDQGWIHEHGSDRWVGFGSPTSTEPPTGAPASVSLGPARGLERREAYEDAVARVIDLIHAGDAFQVNLAHRLSAAITGSSRAVFTDLARTLSPWHGCYIEHNNDAIASVSPELFLRLGADGAIETRPMKGTRPGDDPSLELSPKDAAELAMIVDLMRNDLGRVAAFGSVRVREARSIEAHGRSADGSPHVWQGVATIEGRLRPGLELDDLMRAAFPPGSVTGAPKVRAMQIIDELEPSLGFDAAMPGRGAYCGACGFIGDDGSALLNVAIRTAIIDHGVCHYPVGAGIVADSDPAGEWRETLVKAAPFLDLCAEPLE